MRRRAAASGRGASSGTFLSSHLRPPCRGGRRLATRSRRALRQDGGGSTIASFIAKLRRLQRFPPAITEFDVRNIYLDIHNGREIDYLPGGSRVCRFTSQLFWIFTIMDLCGIEETKWKYSPPSLQRLPNSGQPSMLKYSRAGNRSRRPCGNSSKARQPQIVNSLREVRPHIPSGSAFRPLQKFTSRLLSFARFPRFEGSATTLRQPEIINASRDNGRAASSDDEVFPSRL